MTFAVGDWVKCRCGCEHSGGVVTKLPHPTTEDSTYAEVAARRPNRRGGGWEEWRPDGYSTNDLRPYTPTDEDKLSYVTWLTTKAVKQ